MNGSITFNDVAQGETFSDWFADQLSNFTPVNVAIALVAALLAGAAVSFAGLLSFVGLLAPHIARRLVGNNHRILLPAAMLLGAAFVVLCDVLARCLFAPFELPVGILLSLIGGPFFLGLLLHSRGRRMYD